MEPASTTHGKPCIERIRGVENYKNGVLPGVVLVLVGALIAASFLLSSSPGATDTGGTPSAPPTSSFLDFVVLAEGIQMFRSGAHAGAYAPVGPQVQFNATGVSSNWAELLPDGRLALTTSRNSVIFWNPWEADLSGAVELYLGELTTPVGTTFHDGVLYVACFGGWVTTSAGGELPGAGIAAIELATMHVTTHRYDNRSHVHNVYTFRDGAGELQIYAAVLGNPWHEVPVVGDGLVKFDRAAGVFVSYDMQINVRSAAQQSDGVIYVC